MNAPGASPSGFSNGATPTGTTPNGTTPNGTGPRFVRRPAQTDPMRPRAKKPVRKQLSDYNASANRPNSGQPMPVKNGAMGGMGRGIVPQQPQPSNPMTYGGWTHQPKGEVADFPLVTTVRQLKEDLKFHVLRFSSKKNIDPADPEEFLRPVSLHRRNPQQLPVGKFKDEDVVMGENMDDKEREKFEIAKQEKEEKRAAELALIAPSLSTATKKNASYKLGKTTQVRHINTNEQDQKESNNRYEEALPWHLEDAENSQTWMGIYEAALSETHVALVPKEGKYHMIPVEKWYKFTSKNHFKTMTTEEAEAAMNKKVKEPRWVMERDAQFREARERERGKYATGLFTVKGESSTFRNANKGELNDVDDLDYEEMDFQDDEEHVTVERDPGQDEREAEERVKRDQLKANLFGEADELAADKEAEKEEREAEEAKQMGRELTKALVKREKNYIYDSDSEEYSSSSDEDSEEKRKLKEEKRKKEEEAKLKIKTESKATSGASTKGTNTPLGRPPKNPDLKKSSLKRAGSPNLSASEASGTESARKKHKTKHSSQSGQPSSSQGGNGQRVVKLPVNSDKMSKITSGSPRPADAGDDTEMSDAAVSKKKTIKIRGGANVNGSSPPGSRAGSPIPYSVRAGSAAGSRAGSPPAANATANKTTVSTKALDITAADIHAALPPDGILSSDLLALFKVREYSPQAQKEFIGLVKSVSIMSKGDRKLKPKPVVFGA